MSQRIFIWPPSSTTVVTPPIQYLLDGAATTVSKDTITPANSKPLPVELTGTAGPINITAGDLNVQLTDQGANPDVTRIGNGTNQLQITASGEAKVSDATLIAGTAKVQIVDASANVGQIKTLGTQVTSTDNGLIVNSVIHGLSTAGGVYVDVKVNPSGALTADVTGSTVGLVAGSAIVGKVGIDQTTPGTTNGVSLAQVGATTVATGNGIVGAGVQRVAIASDNTPYAVKIDQTTPGTTNGVSLAQVGATTVATGNGVAGAGVQRVTIASDNTPYPIKIDQTTVGTTNAISLAQLGANAIATGNGTATTGTLRVALASDTTTNTNPLLFKQAGKTQANAPVRNDYTSTSVTTGAYVQLVASTTSATTEIEIFDSSGQTLYLATGAAASEVNQIIIFPGGNGRVPLAIAAGTRVSIKAISATASVGEIDINFYA